MTGVNAAESSPVREGGGDGGLRDLHYRVSLDLEAGHLCTFCKMSSIFRKTVQYSFQCRLCFSKKLEKLGRWQLASLLLVGGKHWCFTQLRDRVGYYPC